MAKWTIVRGFSRGPKAGFSPDRESKSLSFALKTFDGISTEPDTWKGLMRTEGNQLASVGQRRIWSLSVALLQEEVFQTVRILRDGPAKPLLDEETQSFQSTTIVAGRFKENHGSDVTVVRSRQVARASATSCNLLHKSDASHRP